MTFSPNIEVISPLRPQNTRGIGAAVSRRKLSFDVGLNVAKPTLSQLYHCNLDIPPQIDPHREFFKLREAVEKIETVIHTSPSLELANYWRNFISDVLTAHLSHDQKMAELGTILFYLDKDPANFSKLRNEPNLLQYRAKELHQEACDYQTSLAPSLQLVDAASGFAHYLQRALSNMVLTTGSQNRFNRGGLYAVKELLLDPRLLIAQHLQPEHLERIISIAEELLSKDLYVTFFNQQVQVHESLKDLIRFDIKLPSYCEINSRLVLQDCLMALFSDVRQYDRGNCYAIGAFIYATENHTHKTLQKTLEWLTTGYFHIDSRNIPIRPILEARLTAAPDLDVTVPKKDLLQSVPTQHICDTLQLSLPNADDEDVKVVQPIGKTLENILEENEASKQKKYVAGMFAGYKFNALVKMHTAALELTSANCSDFKSLLINAVVFAAANTLAREQQNSLRSKLTAELWLQPSYEKIVSHGNGTYQSGNELIHFFESHEALFFLLNYSTRVFQFDGNRYSPVHSITDLRATVKRIMTQLNLPPLFNAESFSRQIAGFCASKIEKSLEIHQNVLKQADILILSEKGGCSRTVLTLLYGIHPSIITMVASKTPYAFLENLFAQLKTVQLRAASQFPKLLLESHDHVWTIAPGCWKILTVANRNFKQFVQENVFKIAKSRLKNEIDYDLFIRIIAKLHGCNINSEELEEWFEAKEKRTFREVKDILLLKSRASKKVCEIIDQEFSKITMTTELLSRTLTVLELKVSTPTFHKLFSCLSKYPDHPHTLARQLRKGLLQHAVGNVALDSYDIEVALSREAKMPRAFSLGDLNYADNHGEAPAHQTLRIEYSYSDNTLGYYMLRKGESLRQPNNDYRLMSIYHPKQPSTVFTIDTQ